MHSCLPRCFATSSGSPSASLLLLQESRTGKSRDNIITRDNVDESKDLFCTTLISIPKCLMPVTRFRRPALPCCKSLTTRVSHCCSSPSRHRVIVSAAASGLHVPHPYIVVRPMESSTTAWVGNADDNEGASISILDIQKSR